MKNHLKKKFLALTVLLIFFSRIYSQTFTEVSHAAGIDYFNYSPMLIGGGCAFFDYNNDGWLDIYITGGLKRDQLYRNNHDGTFTEVGIAAGLGVTANFYTMGVVTGDIDNDGYRDIFVTTMGTDESFNDKVPNLLFRNNRNGTFSDISQSAGIKDSAWSVSASMGDYNLDGHLDIYVGNYIDSLRFIKDSITHEIIGFAHRGYPDFLYLNNGNNTFTQVAPAFHVDNRGNTLGTAFTDYDNDQDMDIYVANDFGGWVLPNVLYRNDYPSLAFTDVSAASGTNAAIYGMGIAIGDYDEDGDLDYYVTNIGRNVLYRNNGNGTFTDVADSAGVTNTYIDTLLTTSWGTVFFDYDNDTWLDLFVSNGQIPAADFIATGEKDPKKLYKNNRNGTFTDVSLLEGINDSTKGRGCATGDYDNDGDLDVLVVCTTEDSTKSTRVLLFRNDSPNGMHWLKVEVQGTTNNRDGFGSHVEVYANGRKWIREIDGGSSHASQNSSITHFGLGNYMMVDSIAVLWPGSGKTVVKNIPVDQVITVFENGMSYSLQDLFAELCEGDSIFAAGSFQTSSGIYYDTLLSSTGLDSIIVTHLAVHPKKYFYRHFDICEGDSILIDGIYFYSDTVLHDTLATSHACDSIIVSEITMMPLHIAISDVFLCDGDSIFAQGAWRKQNGSYYDTIPGNALCDHVIITSVFVLPPVESDTNTVFICPGDSLFAGGTYQTSTGYYQDLFQTAFGCDSSIITKLTVGRTDTTVINLSICEGDSILAGGDFQTEAGDYYDDFTNTRGCDSLVISKLSVNTSYLNDTFVSISAGDSFLVNGVWQTTPGIYVDTFITSNGCDSLVRTELNVEPNGIKNYFSENSFWNVYPNPAGKEFIIDFFIPAEETMEINMMDISGKRIFQIMNGKAVSGTHELKVENSNASPGIYFIVLKTSSHFGITKLVVY